MDYKRTGGSGLLGEMDNTATTAVAAAEASPSMDKIPQMITSFTTGITRLDYFLKRAKSLAQYQFAFTLGMELMKTANTVQKVNMVWKTIADAHTSRFVKE